MTTTTTTKKQGWLKKKSKKALLQVQWSCLTTCRLTVADPKILRVWVNRGAARRLWKAPRGGPPWRPLGFGSKSMLSPIHSFLLLRNGSWSAFDPYRDWTPDHGTVDWKKKNNAQAKSWELCFIWWTRLRTSVRDAASQIALRDGSEEVREGPGYRGVFATKTR